MSALAHQVCRVGRYRFRITSANPELLQQTVTVFPVDDDQTSPCDLIDLDLPNTFFEQPERTDEPVSAIKRVISQAEAAHEQHLFFDACCLITPKNQSVFMAGKSFAGKSTLAAALLSASSWKVVSEDIVLLDQERGEVIPLTCPISLRQTAPAILRECTGVEVAPFLFGRWFLPYAHSISHGVPARFDLAICLEGIAGNGPFTPTKVDRRSFLHKLISYGNWLSIPDAPDYVYQCFERSEFWCVSGGDLSERLSWTRNVVNATDFGQESNGPTVTCEDSE